jgi:hypothetical protein
MPLHHQPEAQIVVSHDGELNPGWADILDGGINDARTTLSFEFPTRKLTREHEKSRDAWELLEEATLLQV